MKFKVDENLSSEVVELLRFRGHDAMTVLEQKLGGQPDDRIAGVVREEGRAFITLDLDFSNIQNYPPTDYAGIIVLRTMRQDNATILRLIETVMPALERELLAGRLWIVEEGRLRIR